MSRKVSTEEFIKRSNAIHNNEYIYSSAKYVRMHDKVEIICHKHGSFFQEPHSHLKGRGCPKCRYEKSAKK